ncbi:MAG: metallophosphoesterase [Ignavibacteriae bacterium]|nr:metallophosphoesterase [Ignavibacteriota bacterium]
MIFRVFIPTLLLTLQFVLYIRTRNWTRRRFPNKRWISIVVATLFLVMNTALLVVLILRPKPEIYSDWFKYTAVYPFFIWHGATIFIGLVVLISMIIKSPFLAIWAFLKRLRPTREHITALQAKPAYQSFDSSRRVFLRRSMYGLTAASFGASAYGMFYEKNGHEVTNVQFRVRNLPKAFHGFTIALVSDIHSSVNMLKDEMDKYVGIVNSLRCDLVLVTGDFVNSLTSEVYPFAEAFSSLSAPHGVYGVMGNHDYFAPQPETVAKEVDACGIQLLRNDKALIKKNGSALYLIGLDDVGNPKRIDEALERTLSYAPLNIPKLLMVHRPYFLQQAANKDIDLVFSGHTHGGQVVLATIGKAVIAPASLASRYVWGKYSIGNTQMYVNRGIGTVGLPIRLNCPPEITKITLMPQEPEA